MNKIRIVPFLLAVLVMGCDSSNSIEKDAKSAADFMCKTREYVARLSEGDVEVLEELEDFEKKHKEEIENLSEKYLMETEKGKEFMDLVNKELEKCTHSPF